MNGVSKITTYGIAILLILLASLALATGNSKPPDCPPGLEKKGACDDGAGNVEVTIDNEARSDADATAKSYSDSEANAAGVGIAHSAGGDAESSSDSRSESEGGDASVGDTSATASGGAGGDAASVASSGDVSGSVTNDIDVQDDGVTIEGSTYSYKYEEAAKSAAILYGQVCQDTTNLQGVSFGIGRQTQSPFCQRMALATGYFSTAMMHDCPDAPSVLKGGGKALATPHPTTCQLDQRRAYLNGMDEMDKARTLLDNTSPGIVKKVWNWIW